MFWVTFFVSKVPKFLQVALYKCFSLAHINVLCQRNSQDLKLKKKCVITREIHLLYIFFDRIDILAVQEIGDENALNKVNTCISYNSWVLNDFHHLLQFRIGQSLESRTK